jgi:predicted dithiol-disulfide oxidoreductase (DUF899 family)
LALGWPQRLEKSGFHLAERINIVVIAKTSPERLGAYAQERGWHSLRLLSFRNNTFNSDYHAETAEGVQLAVLNVFSRGEDGIRRHWASENVFKSGSTSPLDPIWSIFGALDLTREGRGDIAGYPNLRTKKVLAEAGRAGFEHDWRDLWQF